MNIQSIVEISLPMNHFFSLFKKKNSISAMPFAPQNKPNNNQETAGGNYLTRPNGFIIKPIVRELPQ